MQRVCVGLCTIQRPQMLRKAITSVLASVEIDTLDVRLIIVDNDQTPSSKDIVDEFSKAGTIPIHYFHEVRRGIAHARNRVLKEALSFKPDWIVFFDDDQTVAPDCIARLFEATELYKADVVRARVKATLPQPIPFWTVIHSEKTVDAIEDGKVANNAGTCGVLFSSKLVMSKGMDLRFDENLALSGGEDSDFFSRSKNQGAKIVFSEKAIVKEEIHVTRLNYFRYIVKGLSTGSQKTFLYRRQKGFASSIFKFASPIFLRILRGIMQIIISPIFVPVNMNQFKFTALEGGRNIFYGLGLLGGIFSLHYKYYNKIDGY